MKNAIQKESWINIRILKHLAAWVTDEYDNHYYYFVDEILDSMENGDEVSELLTRYESNKEVSSEDKIAFHKDFFRENKTGFDFWNLKNWYDSIKSMGPEIVIDGEEYITIPNHVINSIGGACYYQYNDSFENAINSLGNDKKMIKLYQSYFQYDTEMDKNDKNRVLKHFEENITDFNTIYKMELYSGKCIPKSSES